VGYPQQVQVDPARLTSIAGEVEAGAVRLGSALSSARDALAPPGSPEWAVFGASRSAQQAWVGFLTGLGAAVSGLATDLNAAAKAYAESDRAAADRVGGTRSGRTGPV
jgi:uncharacterized protein YukE